MAFPPRRRAWSRAATAVMPIPPTPHSSPGSARENSSTASAMTSRRTSMSMSRAGWTESCDYSTWTPLMVSSAGSRPNTFFTNNPYLSPDAQAALTAAATAAGNFVPAPLPFTQVRSGQHHQHRAGGGPEHAVLHCASLPQHGRRPARRAAGTIYMKPRAWTGILSVTTGLTGKLSQLRLECLLQPPGKPGGGERSPQHQQRPIYGGAGRGHRARRHHGQWRECRRHDPVLERNSAAIRRALSGLRADQPVRSQPTASARRAYNYIK